MLVKSGEQYFYSQEITQTYDSVCEIIISELFPDKKDKIVPLKDGQSNELYTIYFFDMTCKKMSLTTVIVINRMC